MDKKITIGLSGFTHEWLERESTLAGKTPAAFLTGFLEDIADPNNIEAALIDEALMGAVSWFPPLMDLDEQTEMREEVLDSLCYLIREQCLSEMGMTLSDAEVHRLRHRLGERAKVCWDQP
jgi:hypothetical protein